MVRAVPSSFGIAKERALTGPVIRGRDGRQLIFGRSTQRVGASNDDAIFITVFVAAGKFCVHQSGVLTSRGKSFRLRVFPGSNRGWRTQAAQRFGQAKICSAVGVHGFCNSSELSERGAIVVLRF